MKRLYGKATEPRPDRPATQLLHDCADLRVVAFCLQPGQEVKPHRSTSTVMLQVIEGEGEFTGAEGAELVSAGDSVVYEHEELHGIRAGESPLRFLALITPRPS